MQFAVILHTLHFCEILHKLPTVQCCIHAAAFHAETMHRSHTDASLRLTAADYTAAIFHIRTNTEVFLLNPCAYMQHTYMFYTAQYSNTLSFVYLYF